MLVLSSSLRGSGPAKCRHIAKKRGVPIEPKKIVSDPPELPKRISKNSVVIASDLYVEGPRMIRSTAAADGGVSLPSH